MALVSSEARVDGPLAVLTQVYRIGPLGTDAGDRADRGQRAAGLRDEASHWRETATMLRTQFPVAVHAEEATYEIQFGHIRRPTHRNTTWDLARDEVAAHKWVDLSQRDYGVALLNDSKYGHKIKGNVIDLNLLRSAFYPGANRERDKVYPAGEPHLGYTDQCDHEFTYAFYPHAGDAVEGGVIEEAYALNVPLTVTPVTPHAGSAPRSVSWVSLDTPNVVIEAVKQAEDGNDVIVRLYEAGGTSADALLTLNFPVDSIFEADLMENVIGDLAVADGAVRLPFTPFEIKTLRIKLGA